MNGRKVSALVTEANRIGVVPPRVAQMEWMAHIIAGKGKLNVAIRAILDGFKLYSIWQIQAIVCVDCCFKEGAAVRVEGNLGAFAHDPTVAMKIGIELEDLGKIARIRML